MWHKVAVITPVERGPKCITISVRKPQLLAMMRPQERIAQRIAHMQPHRAARVHCTAARGEASAWVIDQVRLERHMVWVVAC